MAYPGTFTFLTPTKPNLLNQTKPATPILPIRTYQTKSPKLNKPTLIYCYLFEYLCNKNFACLWELFCDKYLSPAAYGFCKSQFRKRIWCKFNFDLKANLGKGKTQRNRNFWLPNNQKRNNGVLSLDVLLGFHLFL